MQVVIAASILFFKTPASMTNIAGTAVALTGVLLYSLVKRTVKDRTDADTVRRRPPRVCDTVHDCSMRARLHGNLRFSDDVLSRGHAAHSLIIVSRPRRAGAGVDFARGRVRAGVAGRAVRALLAEGAATAAARGEGQ